MNSSSKIQLCSQDLCTGCMACKQKCSYGAITTEINNGFAYPAINTEKCKACRSCLEVCPILNIHGEIGNRHENTQSCLAARNKSSDIREKSSSGGAFSALAEYVLSIGGIVFGAAWTPQMELKHKAIYSIKDLESIRKSKYVQSDVNETFKEVENLLKENKTVLYCGTHCQIAGLKFFLRKKYDNLYLVDILCQGVPSPKLLRRYFDEIENQYNSKICNCNFRSKKKAWRCGLSLEITLENGRKIQRVLNHNEYYNAFYNEFFMRESCYRCKFKPAELGFFSDITLADFWRIGDTIPFNEEHYEKGYSAIITNTIQGEKLLNSCHKNLSIEERTWKEFSTNGGLNVSRKPTNNEAAYHYLEKNSWHDTQKKYFPIGKKRLLYDFLLLIVGEKYVRRAKKYLYKVIR